MVAERVSLEIRCPHCGGELTVDCGDWLQNGDLHRVELQCPYCRKSNVAGLPARQVLITRRETAGGRPH
jgi:hypothetical protein